MNLPFLNLQKVNAEIEPEITQAVASAISSGWYILGKFGEQFEAELKRFLCGPDEGYVIGCNSGTDALQLSLLGAAVDPGDEVITVSHTAIPTVSAICAVRATPVLIDIDPRTWVMDTDAAIRAVTEKTKAIIPVHLYGNMVDVRKLQAALGKIGREDIAIVEDVAQAHGATLHGQQAGTLGRFGAFSFYPSKNIGALGDAGAVFSSSLEDIQALRALRNYGQKDRYNAETPRGINSRLDEIQAAILAVKLHHLDRWLREKATMMARYHTGLSAVPVSFQEITPGCEPAWHLCVIAVETASLRTRLIQHLTKEEIQTLIHYPIPTHKQQAFSLAGSPSLPTTEDLADRILSLPLNNVLAQEEQDKVIDAVRNFYS